MSGLKVAHHGVARRNQARFDLASWRRCATTASRPSSSLFVTIRSAVGGSRKISAASGAPARTGPAVSGHKSEGYHRAIRDSTKCAPRASRQHGPCAELRLLSSILASQLLHTLTAVGGTQCACPRSPRPRQNLRVLRTKTEPVARCGGQPVTRSGTFQLMHGCAAGHYPVAQSGRLTTCTDSSSSSDRTCVRPDRSF